MRSSIIVSVLVALVSGVTAADGVKGAAEGFAKGVSGGGNAAPVYPKSITELKSYLSDSQPRVIVLTKTFDFTGSEGTASDSGCAPWGNGSQCQQAINKDKWCDNYQSDAPKISKITYDKAGVAGMTVGSNKSLIGQGTKGVIKGKGIRIANNAKNIIVQNIRFTAINPKYVWGGDAITIDGGDNIWLDHITTDLIGRQHIVLGPRASNRVTISNSEINGTTPWSATCNAHHYWAIYLTGSNDMVTLQKNFIHHTSGRAPKVAGNTLLHAVNNVFEEITQHAFEADKGAKILAEGNVFQDVKAAQQPGLQGKLFNSGDPEACRKGLKRACQVNVYGASGALTGTDRSVLAGFAGKNVAGAVAVGAVEDVVNTAGYGRI